MWDVIVLIPDHCIAIYFKDVRCFIDYDEDLVHLDFSERHRLNSGMRKFKNMISRIFCSCHHRT